MKKINLVFILAIACALFVCASGVASATTYYVPDDYVRIQWAVDNASDGDTIVVRDGVYVENVNVDKSLDIISENGSAECIVQAANSDDHVFEVLADYVTICGFTIKNATDYESAGVYLLSNNTYISNNIITKNNKGIYIRKADNVTITENNISRNDIGSLGDGIYIFYTHNLTINNNYFLNNSDEGIQCLFECRNISIVNNKIKNNGGRGIDMEGWTVRNISIINNIILSNSYEGISLVEKSTPSDWIDALFYRNDYIFDNNTISLNNGDGIYLGQISRANKIIGNNISSNHGSGIKFGGKYIIYYKYGQPIYTLMSQNNLIERNMIYNNTIGIYSSFSGCDNILENVISNNYQGIYFGQCEYQEIENNQIFNNAFGMELRECKPLIYQYNPLYYLIRGHNLIERNTIHSNTIGINLTESSTNKFCLNNFLNNTNNVHSYNSANIWNSTEKITYTYKGKTFANYIGNYWSDYNGVDSDGDGIGETPYIIDGDMDEYPLIERFENYFVPTQVQIFDTGRPENPYPSISGKFIGTIKTNKKIIATKLYTYACEGTGGHTEYAIICNKTWCAEAKWEGYKEDWMNISFNRTVVLMPYETYNITIVTGSYPQIHHTSSLKTENGWINCTEFIDANGKKYENWIPAIKLWS